MEKITRLDLLDYRFLSTVSYAPDGKSYAFLGSKGDVDSNAYESVIYVYDGVEIRQLTSSGKESMFLWEDSDHLLFVNVRDEADRTAVANGEERTCFYRISIHGGEATKAFTIPLVVTSIKQLTKGCYAFTANYDLLYSYMYILDDVKKQEALKNKKEMEDYEILDELPFYGNGQGFTNKKRNTLFLYEESSSAIKRISDELCNVSDYEYHKGKDTIFFVGEMFTQKLKNKDTLFAYDCNNQVVDVMLASEQYAIAKIQPWNDRLLVIASNQEHYGVNENSKFYMWNSQSRDLDLFADYEEALGSSVGSDCRYGSGRSVKLYEDTFYFITTIVNRSVVYALDTQGNITPVYDHEGSVDMFDIANQKILFCGMQDMQLQELYTCDLAGNHCQQQSHFNEKIMKHKDVRPCIPCNFEQDGKTMYGWVLEPSGYDPTLTYPAILDIHGGPKTVYGEVYYHEMQLWANMGYFVFFMNPRGGDGQGNTFMDIRGKYGTIDYEDLMNFTDLVLKTYPAIDTKRLGVTGGSYGGFMTNWIIGHTNRFQAAASQRSISNWISFAYTSDIGEMFAKDQQAATIWDNQEKLWSHSPLKYANNCTTPTLFIHSNEDYRCPLSEGIQMYSALCEHGIETRLCMFKGENHELSRSGKPKHRLKRLEEITNWMEHYLN